VNAPSIEETTEQLLGYAVERAAREAISQLRGSCFIDDGLVDFTEELFEQAVEEPQPSDYGATYREHNEEYMKALNEYDEMRGDFTMEPVITPDEFALLVALEVARLLAREV
jgi:hypothetical protein